MEDSSAEHPDVRADAASAELYARRNAAQYAVARVLAEAPALEQVGPKLLQAICENLQLDFGALWSFESQLEKARCESVWVSPTCSCDGFVKATRELQPVPGIGLSGRVWATGQPAWIPEIANDQNFPRAPAALEAGFRSAIAFPIRATTVLGMLEFFSRIPLPQDADFLKVLDALGSQIGQFIQRKRTEEALLQSEELYRLIVETASDVIITMDEHSTIVAANPAAERIFGYRPDELLGRSMTMLMPERLRARHRAGVERFLATGERRIPWSGVELPGLCKDGREIPLEIAFGMLRTVSGVRLTGTLRDISRRKQAEQELKAGAERLRFMAESMPQKIFTAKPTGEVDYFNQQWTEFTGLSFDQIRDWGWVQFIHPDDREDNIRRWKHSIATAEPFQIEHRFRRHDGVYRWHLSRAHALRDPQGNVIMWIGSNTDIEDQKRAEENLEQTVAERTAKLRETIGELEAYSYSISHDMRAPLRAMQTYAHVLLTDYAGQLDTTARRYLDRIMNSSQRLDKLIQDVLSYSRVARADINYESVNLDRLVENICDEYPSVRAGELQIGRPLGSVIAAEALLAQAISNLLTNAAKFVAPGQTPRIKIWSEQVSHSGGGLPPLSPSGAMNPPGQSANYPFIRLFIQDNAIGIAPEDQQRVFGIFSRVHSDKEYEGTGIGLSIVKKAVERMGGTLGLHSELGTGSTFWIQLPRA